jgi:hypothetical protein
MYSGNNQGQPAEPFITINRTSQSAIIKKEIVFMDVETPGDKNVIKK